MENMFEHESVTVGVVMCNDCGATCNRACAVRCMGCSAACSAQGEGECVII